MKRRQFMSAMALGLAAPAIWPKGARAQEVTLRLHQFQPPQATIAARILKPWVEQVREATGGALAIEQFDAMALGGRPQDLMDQARDGVVDIVMTMCGYTPGRFPRSEVFELPFISTNDTEATSLAFQALIEERLQAEEFTGTRILGGFVHGPGVIHASRRVESLDDMKGLKIRAPTRTINALVEQLGAAAVGMPLTGIPEALSKGVIDGTVIPWEVTPAIRLSELVTHHTEFDGDHALYTGTIVVAMNQGRYDALPEALRAGLDSVSGAKLSQLAGHELRAADAPGREIAVARGNDIVTIGAEATAAWREAAQPVTDNWIAEMTGKGFDAAALVEDVRARLAG